MAKKEYQQPSIITRVIHPSTILAGSGEAGASGEDAPFKAKSYNFIEWSSQNENSGNN